MARCSPRRARPGRGRERIESELTDARRALAALQGDITGTVVIGAFQSVIQALLVPLVADLEERLPGLDLLVQEVAAEEGMRQLREGAPTCSSSRPTARRASAPRGTHDVAVLDEPVAGRRARDAHRCPARSTTGPVTWLGVDPAAAAHRATGRVLATFAKPPPVAHVYSDSDVAISMVAGGMGVALLPSLALLGRAATRRRSRRSRCPGWARVRWSRGTAARAPSRGARSLTVLNEIVEAAGALDLSAV